MPRAARRLTAEHDVSAFRSGRHFSQDDWLQDRALANEGLSARTYVVCAAGARPRVIGYYAISTAMEQRIALPNVELRRGMPEQVPLLLIGRLSDALRRCLAASGIVGARGVVVHAIDEDAARFYRRRGFLASPLGERVMGMPIETVRVLFTPD